jgi:GNAT superfamily N-acetyltransferase
LPRADKVPVPESTAITELGCAASSAEFDIFPASAFGTPELAAYWNRASDGSPEQALEPGRFSRFIAINDIDPEQSLVAMDSDGGFVGLSLLAARGIRGWIGGLGIDPLHRRRGFAYSLVMEQLAVARSAGLASVQIEVPEQPAARRAFERAGFQTTQHLEELTGTLRASDGGELAARISVAVALEEAQRMRCGRSWPWQRELGTLVQCVGSRTEALSIGENGSCGAVAVYQPEGRSLLRILDLSGGPVAVSALLRALARRFPGRMAVVSHEPVESGTRPQLLDAGLAPARALREMAFQL